MTAYKGYYSLIQFCPDRSRAEVANVGVLLFCPELGFIDALIGGQNDRLKRFFGSERVDIKGLRVAKEGIRQRLETERSRFRNLEDLEEFIRTRANDLLITEPRFMKVRDPRSQLDELFEELVAERIRESREAAEYPQLHRIFEKPAIARRIRLDQRVTVPRIDRVIEIPYAYKNGAMNLVKPQRLQNGAAGLDRAMALAFEGELIQAEPDEEGNRRQLIVCLFGEDSAKGREIEQRAAAVLRIKSVRPVMPCDLPEFEREIEAQAH